MDWTELSFRLADGQKVYRAFQDGAEAAAKLASLERARNELQAQYDALPGQIAQAQADLQAVKDQTTQALAEGAQQIAAQAKDASLAARQRRAEVQADLDLWTLKISTQAAAYESQGRPYRDQITDLEARVAQLTEQIASLEGIKQSLKTQLQTQLQGVA